jgi:hypothetical protein
MSRLILASAALACALTVDAQPKPNVRTLVERAHQWVEQFERDFIAVVADEEYDQRASDGSGAPPSHRQIHSELLFLRPEAGGGWVAVRNVLSYSDDGEPPIEVPNSRDRLTRALERGRADGRSALRRLADESARFNIGKLARNFNTPTLALQFLDETHRDRFKFRLEGSERLGSEDVWRLKYEERSHPTIIQANFRDIELTGYIWSRASDGAIVRTQLELDAKPNDGHSGLHTTVTVDYSRDEKLDRMVPSRMQEDYAERAGSHHVSAAAVYSNYRVFETSARVVSSP